MCLWFFLGPHWQTGSQNPSLIILFVFSILLYRHGMMGPFQFNSVQSLSRVQLIATPWTVAHQASLSINNSGTCSNSCPSSQWCHPTISSSVVPSPPAFNLFQHQGLFKWVSSLHQVAKLLEFQLQHQSFQWIFKTDILQNGLVGSPCSPRDSQESSPIPQFKSINSSALSFLHSPTLTYMRDYWKNHSFD